jgi:hypothetical protein
VRERCDCGGDDDRRRKSSGGGKIAAAMMFRWRFNGEFDSGGEFLSSLLRSALFFFYLLLF